MLTKEEGLLGFRTRAPSGVSFNLKQPRMGELGPEAAQELLLLGLGVGAFIVTGPLSCTPRDGALSPAAPRGLTV